MFAQSCHRARATGTNRPYKACLLIALFGIDGPVGQQPRLVVDGVGEPYMYENHARCVKDFVYGIYIQRLSSPLYSGKFVVTSHKGKRVRRNQPSVRRDIVEDHAACQRRPMEHNGEVSVRTSFLCQQVGRIAAS